MTRTILPCLIALLALTAGPAAAAPLVTEDTVAYAIVVGSNPGGPGQAELRFAEADAARVADVLRDVGGYPADHVRVVLRPDPGQLRATLDQLATELAAEFAAGHRTVVFFYYSGHARARALNLGADEMPLAELRERITALPASLTVVVLDACQSGSFSRIKGAAPAADFSFNSRTQLDATGIAVMASSAGSELSQESDRLGSGYFTHHLLVGLRGGGDANHDGRVSLDEAYRYAYHQTLLSTAATAVGSQHVSLEVDLKGKGEVALTYPEKADARLGLPASLDGDVVIERLPAEAVVAELHKAAGGAVELALPAGSYRVMIRTGARYLSCPTTLRSSAISAIITGACEQLPLATAVAKGFTVPAAPTPPWNFEVALGFGGAMQDAYTDRLEDFGYGDDGLFPETRLALTGWRLIAPRIAVFGELANIGGTQYSRSTEISPLRISWNTTTLGAGVRGVLPLSNRIRAYAQVGGGLAMARTHFLDEADRSDNDTFWGWHLGAAAGLSVRLFWNISMGGQVSYVTSPTIDNLLGDTHDSGGLFVGYTLSKTF